LGEVPAARFFLLPGKAWDTYKRASIRGLTDDNGEFRAEGRTMTGPGVGAHPEGYCMSGRSIFLNENENGKWLPFPRFETLILKKILKSVPMYAAARWRVRFDRDIARQLLQSG
jgi:hypothetical protein